MSKDEFVISGYEEVEKRAKPHGNGARDLVPKGWRGEDVKIIKLTDSEKTKSQVASVAALMHESISNEENSLEGALKKMVKFKSFSDMSNDIVEDFQIALNSHSTRGGLRKCSQKSDSEEKSQFYDDICSSESLNDILKRWTK